MFFIQTLTPLVLLSIPFYVLLSLFFTPILRARIDERFQRGAENQCFLVEAVSGRETVKSLAVEPQMQRRWEQQLRHTSGHRSGHRISNVIAARAVGAKNHDGADVMIGARLVMKGELSVGQLIAFNMLSGRVTQPILRLAQLWQNFSRLKSQLKSCLIFSTIRPKIPKPCPKVRCRRLKAMWNLKTLRSVMCRTGREILKKMNFKVKAGQKIGFVGPSGSGKSTVTKLIQRLYIPESGKVLIDGIDISTVDTAGSAANRRGVAGELLI